MNNHFYLHYEKDKKSLIRAYFWALIPIILFSFYKNGILLYQNGYISFLDMFLPFYFYLISVLVGYLVAVIKKENHLEFMLYSLIIACTISTNTNMIIYPILLFVSLFIMSYLARKKNFNFIAGSRILLVLALLLQQYSYLNVGEKIGAFNYSLWDIFLGFGISGIGTSSFLLVLVGFLILVFNKFYKKWIPIFASFIYFILFLGVYFITKDILYLENILNGTVYFAFVFMGSDLYVTPNTKKGMVLYGIMIGLMTFIFNLFLPIYEVPYIVIFLISFLIPFINRFWFKKDLLS